MMAPQCEWRH